MARPAPEHPALRCLLALLLLAPLAACSSGSEVVELSPEIFGLTFHASPPATAARIGVARAQEFCTRQERDFEPVRTQIGARDYTIAFRCPRPAPPALVPEPELPLATWLPPPEETPVRPTRGRGRAALVPAVPGTY